MNGDSGKACRMLVTIALSFFVLLASSSFTNLYATNGYFSHGYGIKYKGLAGAGVAMYLSPMAAATNPGSMAFVGTRYDISISLFNPNREYTVTGNPSGFPQTFGLTPGTVESDSKVFPIPSFGANWALSENVSFGVSVYGNGGMNTNYPTKTFYGTTSTTGVDLSQLFIAPTLSFKVNDRHGFGVTPIVAFQLFEAKGLQAFSNFSSNPAKLSDNGHDNALGIGFKVGYFGQWLDFLAVGASYQSKIYMGEFNDYAGLFADQGDFDIPASWTAGVAFGYEALALLFDVQRILYSDITSIANPMLPNLQKAPLGSKGAAGFGWDDMTVYKIGAQISITPGWTWRAGFSFGDQPIPESEVMFNILAPGVIEQHLTFGLTKSVGENKELNFVIMRAFSHSVKGPNPLEAPGQQTIELKMDQWEFGVGLTF